MDLYRLFIDVPPQAAETANRWLQANEPPGVMLSARPADAQHPPGVYGGPTMAWEPVTPPTDIASLFDQAQHIARAVTTATAAPTELVLETCTPNADLTGVRVCAVVAIEGLTLDFCVDLALERSPLGPVLTAAVLPEGLEHGASNAQNLHTVLELLGPEATRSMLLSATDDRVMGWEVPTPSRATIPEEEDDPEDWVPRSRRALRNAR